MNPLELEADRRAASQSAADIFNSAVASWAIAAGWEIGALDELSEKGKLDTRDFSEQHDLHVQSVRGMFTALASVGVVERDGDTILPGSLFDEVFQTKSFFHWLSRGSAPLFTAMPTVMKNANRVGDFYTRDAPAISYACREINAEVFDPLFWSVMESLDFPFTKVADLGCGSGERLRQIARRHAGVQGIGLDIAARSLEAAEASTVEAGLGDRISFGIADARALEPRPELVDVDLVTSFMMAHDFWPREECISSFRKLREVFPNARRFLLADTARLTDLPDHRFPMFNLGFEVGHDLMGVYLPTMEDWEGVFPEAGWRLVKTHRVQGLTNGFIFELE
ncbi:methyltransferase domain-containing protein [Micromonospora sp. ALFpr18c]|uniref:class I SAM-dependent methyltransferase n=1 Tax=unclassified Micromonospora TaxID=2617518 RepID=UPI00124B32ED|nr:MULTISPECIES: class I SAM-dependent methyltransferase [unclassified Micromonospora]KAB1943837.1 methyltransferase domain-containing protein [Micromonospora sp. ALFpr18c]MDG4759968.1 class I SAM-dependent methyltransferase [Micromonospora sp. WMMD710]